MDWKRSLLALMAFGLMVPSGMAAGRGKTEAPNNELPVKIYNGYLIVAEGSIGGMQGLRLLLDTGTSVTAIDRHVAKKLGVAGEQTKVFNFDKMVPVEWGQVPEISFGPEQATDVPVLIEDLSYLRAGETPVDGVIGLDLLGRQSFLVDYGARRIVFGAADTDGMNAVPMRADGTKLCVKVQLDGRQAWMVADTGVRQTVLYERGPEATLENYRIQGRIVTRSMGGTIENRLASVLQLKLGNQELDNKVVLLSAPAANKLSDVAGYLGPASLHAKQVVFDFESGQLRWKK